MIETAPMTHPSRRSFLPALALIGSLVLSVFPEQGVGGKPMGPRIHPVTGAKLFTFAPGLEISPDARELYLHSKVSLDSGILEFLLVQGKKKAYESALSTDASPSQLMAGMILLKWKPGDLLAITLLQDKDTLPLTALLRARDTVAPGPDLGWRLAGSNHDEVEKNRNSFWADQEGIHIALVERPESVVQLDGSLKNPYHNAGFGYAIRPARNRKSGTAITLIIRKAMPKAP